MFKIFNTIVLVFIIINAFCQSSDPGLNELKVIETKVCRTIFEKREIISRGGDITTKTKVPSIFDSDFKRHNGKVNIIKFKQYINDYFPDQEKNRYFKVINELSKVNFCLDVDVMKNDYGEVLFRFIKPSGTWLDGAKVGERTGLKKDLANEFWQLAIEKDFVDWEPIKIEIRNPITYESIYHVIKDTSFNELTRFELTNFKFSCNEVNRFCDRQFSYDSKGRPSNLYKWDEIDKNGNKIYYSSSVPFSYDKVEVIMTTSDERITFIYYK